MNLAKQRAFLDAIRKVAQQESGGAVPERVMSLNVYKQGEKVRVFFVGDPNFESIDDFDFLIERAEIIAAMIGTGMTGLRLAMDAELADLAGRLKAKDGVHGEQYEFRLAQLREHLRTIVKAASESDVEGD